MAWKANFRKTPMPVREGWMDPVCNMTPDQTPTGELPFAVQHDGKEFGFCSRRCATLFEQAPYNYLMH
ncbi:MAG TPA: YHS domain-containing protein [Candidatus Thermoplasmatota archaeon]|nr:YHS domain-containing protein [Candidatus Thermoplasmatota archaeon]